MSGPSRGIRPPDHILPWHRSADLGYPDFLPPRPGQEEDSMHDSYVKTGYVGKPIVATDSFTVHEMIHETWEKNGQNVLGQLGNLMSEVYVRRNKMLPTVGPSTFKAPDRRTVNEARKAAWIADLANPNVPLSKLGNFVPPGPKGHDLLDMLESNKVATSRAVWYIRVLGAADLQNMGRARTNFDWTPYTIDWTNIITSYIKKQLGEIVLPRAPAGQSTAIKSSFRSILSESESRDKWTAKFSFSLDLLRVFYAESLVDHSTFLFWLCQQPSSANLAQLGFVITIADEYLEGLLEHRGFMRPLIEGCVAKMLEMKSMWRSMQRDKEKTPPTSLLSALASLLQKAFIATPDTFVFPRLWTMEVELLLKALFVSEPTAAVPALAQANPVAEQILRTMAESHEDVLRRVNAIQFKSLPDRGTLSVRTIMADIHTLNNVSSTTDISTIRYFQSSDGTLMNQDSESFESKLDILLTWSVVSIQFGDHRPYVASTLLWQWKNNAKLRAIRRHLPKSEYDLQERLLKWLDTSDVARNHSSNLKAITGLYGELCRRNLFSYERFIQRLMARGETGPVGEGATMTHLMAVLRDLPLCSLSMATERRTSLYGTSADGSAAEEAAVSSLRQTMKFLVPPLFNADSNDDLITFDEHLTSVREASPFEQSQGVTHWLLPNATQLLDSELPMSLDIYHPLIEILRVTHAYPAILDINLRLLQQTTDPTLIGVVLETLRRHGEIWAAMDELSNIREMLLAAERRLRLSQLTVRALLQLLNKAEFSIPLSSEDMATLSADTEAHDQALRPPTQRYSTIPITIPDILHLSQNDDPAAPRNIALSLYYQYHNVENWARTVWDNVFQGLCQVASSTDDTSDWLLTGAKYAAMLEEVAKLLPILPRTESGSKSDSLARVHPNGELDYQVYKWFIEGNGNQEFFEMQPELWLVMIPFLLDLALRGIVSTSTLLRGLVYGAWTRAASASTELDSVEVFLQAANMIARRVLLLDDLGPNEHPTLPPSSIAQIQTFQTQRRRVYGDKNLSALDALFHSLASLVAVEINQNLREDLRETTAALRVDLCQHSEFRTVACRYMEELREIFLHKARKRHLREIFLHDVKGKELELRLADALRQIVNGDDTSQPDILPSLNWNSLSTGLIEWEFAKVTIELHLSLKHISSQMERPDTKPKAEAELHQFMTSFFGHRMNHEDTDILADVLYGINSVVATKFLNCGFEILTKQISTVSLPFTTLPAFLQEASETLRLLALVLIPRSSNSEDQGSEDQNPEDPYMDESRVPPSLDSFSVDPFVAAFHKAISDIEKNLKPHPTPESPTIDSNLSHTVVLLCRIFQFCLGFQRVWTPTSKKLGEELVGVFIRLAVAFGGGVITDPTLFKLLLDTVSYLMDEIPKDPKTPNIDLIRKIPGVQSNALPQTMPQEFRDALQPLLTYVPRDAYSHNLVHVSADQTPDANSDTGPPVQARPWEWFEHVEPLARPAGEDELDDELRNDTSVSLEYFSARPTGEKLSPASQEGLEARDESEAMFLQDHLHGETMAARQWKASVTDHLWRSDGGGEDDSDSDEEQASEDEDDEIGFSAGISPAPTSARASSTRTLDREIIDVDALPGPSDLAMAKARKRKVPPAASTSSTTTEIIDDDIEIIDSIAPSLRGRRPRGRPPGNRGKAKRKS